MNAAGFRDSEAFDKGLVGIMVEYTSGAVGAIPAALTRANGVASVVRSGVGTIDVTLNEPAFYLASASGEVRQATFNAANANWVMQKSTTDVTSPTAPKVTFELRSSAANAPLADSVAGDIVQFAIVVGALAP